LATATGPLKRFVKQPLLFPIVPRARQLVLIEDSELQG
jgi:hypothetical protein